MSAALKVRPPVAAWRVFAALLRRDVRAAARELPFFLVRTVLQPILFVVVFGYLMPRMGFVSRGYGAALLPGILAISMTLASIQAVALPMVADFGWTKEIEDRLLAPAPIRLVALEKMFAGLIQGVIAAAFILPVARLIMGPIPAFSLSRAGDIAVVAVLGAAAFSALGLLMGTAINPQQIGLMFSVIIAPMIFLGCAYYPWKGLDAVPVLKFAVLVNPLVYVSEGLRGALTPSLPHMHMAAVLAALVAMTVGFGIVGLRSFERRALG